MVNDIAQYVYVLECSDKSFYIGKTVDLEKRLRAHNGLISGGAKYTRSRRPVFLVYYEQVESASIALKKELQLKKLTRKQKEKLFSNPTV